MKHWYRTYPAKICCFILCIVSLCVAAASVVGAAVLISLDFYGTSEKYITAEHTYNMVNSDSYSIMYHTLNDEYHSRADENYYSRDNTNVRYAVYSPAGEVVGSNVDPAVKQDDPIWKYSADYFVTATEEDFSIDYEFIAESSECYTFKAYLEEGLPVEDEYAFIGKIIHLGFTLRYWVYVIGLVALALAVASFSVLMCASARRPRTEEIYAGPLNRVPFDLLLAATIALFVLGLFLIMDVFYTGEGAQVIMISVLMLVGANALLGLCMSIAARIKQRNLIKNTVIFKILALAWRILKRIAKGSRKAAKSLAALFRSIPLIWRTLLAVAALTFFDFIILIMVSNGENAAVLFWIVKSILVIFTALYAAWFMRRLQKGGDALAKGDLSYQVDTDMMYWDFRRHGENLNSIAQGMNIAVEERMQSERMKTELITNVSHDIKTPLTSIINYAGLIAKEGTDSERYREYAEVLVRKSEHLKRLLDDLVEISKANTGNLEVDLVPCEAGVLLVQAAGEFKERCQAADLELITSQPEKSIKIMADSRRIWRVFENLMSNACKYSLTGSRVYLSLEEKNGEALFIFRNTSRAALNISPDELMERFVRGDAARTTEGNGLGLSIAKSLTELQGGKMKITIDGDLFKVTLKFPTV